MKIVYLDTIHYTCAKEVKDGQVFEDMQVYPGQVKVEKEQRTHNRIFLRMRQGTSSAIVGLNLETGMTATFEPSHPIRLHTDAYLTIPDQANPSNAGILKGMQSVS